MASLTRKIYHRQFVNTQISNVVCICTRVTSSEKSTPRTIQYTHQRRERLSTVEECHLHSPTGEPCSTVPERLYIGSRSEIDNSTHSSCLVHPVVHRPQNMAQTRVPLELASPPPLAPVANLIVVELRDLFDGKIAPRSFRGCLEGLLHSLPTRHRRGKGAQVAGRQHISPIMPQRKVWTPLNPPRWRGAKNTLSTYTVAYKNSCKQRSRKRPSHALYVLSR